MARPRTPDGRPPRVLIEALEWVVGQATAEAFRRAGWDVEVCEGPVGMGERCPVLDGGHCCRVDRADVVVSRLALQDVRNRDLIARLAHRGPVPPVVVETPPATFARYRRDLDGCTLVPFPARLPQLVAAAEASLERSMAVAR